MTHIASVTEEEALALARQAVETGRSYGYLDHYMFLVNAWSGQTLITVLDCETKLNALRSLAVISGAACLIGILLAALVGARGSRRAIQPLSESAEKQQRFITDAGHELKTPLTVISANMDILSQDLGPNEWVEGTQKQVGALRALVNELVYLSRLDEEERLEAQRFDLSAAVEEVPRPSPRWRSSGATRSGWTRGPASSS
jgi:signal transduction histidine kinase